MTPEQLRERRLALGLTQEQLGDALGKPRNTITQWESGRVKIGSAKMLSLALEALEKRPQADTSETAERKAAAAGAALHAALQVLS